MMYLHQENLSLILEKHWIHPDLKKQENKKGFFRKKNSNQAYLLRNRNKRNGQTQPDGECFYTRF